MWMAGFMFGGCETKCVYNRAAVALVWKERSGFAVAADTGCVCDLGFGDHAAADAGEDGDSVLGTLDGGNAGCGGAGGGRFGEAAQALGGAGVLHAGAEYAKDGDAHHDV